MTEPLEVGDLVEVHTSDLGRCAGIVSQPTTDDAAGHVLVLQPAGICGIAATEDIVAPAGNQGEGFAQLAHHLLTLASRVIEQRLIVYRS